MPRLPPVRRLLLLALVLTGLAPPAAAQSVAGDAAAWAQDGGWLVVTRFDPATGRTGLWRWEPKSGRETLLAELPGHASRPRLSPDDRFVAVLRTDAPLDAAYQSTGDLVAVDLATGSAETVHPPDWQAVAWSGGGSTFGWHPQGARLAFAAVADEEPNVVGIRMTDLDAASGGQFLHPDLAFAGETVGLDVSPDGLGGGGAYGVWTDAVELLDA
jgi:Tol biopolymer transport system component